MNILQLQSQIEKWEQTSINFTGHILDGEKQSFLLFPDHPQFKTIFNVNGFIYITDPDTDFILDVTIKSIFQLEITGLIPTPTELYEAYLKARIQWNELIFNESINRGIMIKRNDSAPPFEELEGYLKQSIGNTYNRN